MDARREEVCKPRIDPRLHPEGDEVVASECAAFYCILLGHQHEVAGGEVEVAGRPRMVVGERVGHELEALVPQRCEEAPGIADARDSVQTPAPQRRERHVLPGSADAPEAVRRKAHLERARVRR
jgi:hypothetical protein